MKFESSESGAVIDYLHAPSPRLQNLGSPKILTAKATTPRIARSEILTRIDPQPALPTFLLIGAQRCGTSPLSRMIGQHPEVATARRKEVHYFNKEVNYRQGLSRYQSQFIIPATARAVGEFTPNYFWTTDDDFEIEESGMCRNIPEKVFHALPEVKLVLCLRNPVDRAVSAYYHLMKHGYFSPRQGFSEVWKNRGILTMGYYDIHLAHWLEHFPMQSFLVLIYEEDLVDQQKAATLERIFRHIG
ncbi:MAG: sulfotransferase [Gammaproteobacteria bacterium]|nr:sulfotransferase [Gammaproteobacteria bacterium]